MKLGKSNMYEVETSAGGMRCFINEKDAIQYKDFVENGLKCIGRNGNKYYFNDTAIMFFDYVNCFVYIDNKTLKSERFTNKYFKAMGKIYSTW